MKPKKNASQAAAPRPAKHKNHISPDGKWETMSIRGLLKYRPSGVYFGRSRYKGKLLFGSLETTDYTQACARLPKYIEVWKKEFDVEKDQKGKEKKEPTTWQEAAGIYHEQLWHHAKIGDYMFASVECIYTAVRRIASYWPSIEGRAVRDVERDEFLKFFAEARSGEGRFVARVREKGRRPVKGDFRGGKQGDIAYNLMVKVGKEIIEIAQKRDFKKGLAPFDSPLEDFRRVSDSRKISEMPTDDEWAAILTALEIPPKQNRGQHPKLRRLCAEFMAMTGARICEVIGPSYNHHKDDAPHPGFRWKDMRTGYNIITCAKKRGDKKWMERQVPWIDGTRELMSEIRAILYKGNDNALVFEGIRKGGLKAPLKLAIAKCGLQKKFQHFTQHKIRHLFATKCIEIPEFTWKALAEYLGHDDGGILAARLYSHLRKELGCELASKVSYRKKPASTVVSQISGGASSAAPSAPAKVMIGGQEFTFQEVCQMASQYHATAQPS
jgi:integrase